MSKRNKVFETKLNSLICLLIAALSCTGRHDFIPFHQDQNSKTFLETLDLESDGVKIFPLDTRTRFLTNSVQAIQYQNMEFLSFLSSDNESQSIIIYDYNKQDTLERIKLSFEGPHGVGELGLSSSYHFFLNPDTVFVFNILSGNLFSLDSKGKVIDKFTVTDFSDSVIPVPYPSTTTPMVSFNGKLFIPCGLNDYQVDYSSYPSVLELNIKTKKRRYLTTFSPVYSQAFWGSYFKYEPSIAINQDKSILVVNYPIDPWLHTYNLSSYLNFKPQYVGSKFFGAIPPYKNDPKFFLNRGSGVRDEYEDKYAFSNSEYRSIIFDPFRKLYYRIALVRSSIEDMENEDLMPDFSIIILDENFKKVGEKLFSKKKYDFSTIFISSKGINIFRKDLYLLDEEVIQFEVFLPTVIDKTNKVEMP